MKNQKQNTTTANQLSAVLIQLAQGKISKETIAEATSEAICFIGCEGRHDGSLISACVQIVTEACKASANDHLDSAEFYDDEAQDAGRNAGNISAEDALQYSREYAEAEKAYLKAMSAFQAVNDNLKADIIKSNI